MREHIALAPLWCQVCTAAMHYGFRIVEDMADGLGAYMTTTATAPRRFPRARCANGWTGATSI